MLSVMQDDARERVAANVRAEIARKGRSEAAAARALGMSRQAMSPRLRAERAFRAEEIAGLAEWLEVPVSALLGQTTDVAA